MALKEHHIYVNGRFKKCIISYGKVIFENRKQAETFMRKSVRVDVWDVEIIKTFDNSTMDAWSNTVHYKPNTRLWSARLNNN